MDLERFNINWLRKLWGSAESCTERGKFRFDSDRNVKFIPDKHGPVIIYKKIGNNKNNK